MKKIYRRDNIIISWFVWHFQEMPGFLLSVWKNYISFVLNYFSIQLLLATFFNPWRKYRWTYPKGFSIGAYFNTLISNLFSRIVGAICRLFLIILGVAALIFTLITGITVILFWILIPALLILILFYAL